MDKWIDIRNEYITTTIGTRELAKKYGISYSTLQKRATREQWMRERMQYSSGVAAEKVAVAATLELDEYKKLLAAAGLLSDKLYSAISQMDERDIIRDKRGVRSLVGAIKDLADIQGFKPDADKREQEARIRNLEKQINDDATPEPVQIIIAGGDGYLEG